jgi:hypothetical protein
VVGLTPVALERCRRPPVADGPWMGSAERSRGRPSDARDRAIVEALRGLLTMLTPPSVGGAPGDAGGRGDSRDRLDE